MKTSLDRQFLTRLKQGDLRRLRGRILVAVSGGADSVALLSLLSRAAADLDLQLQVAHLDHGLRAESSEDADFVAALAASLRLPVHRQRIEVAPLLGPGKGGPEEVARRVRRQFLERTAATYNCSWIALGHHRQDQAETFLLRLLRGAGTDGLAAMRTFGPPYVRPILGFSVEELRDYLREHRLDWREDASNQSLDYSRNRVRHQLLPLLSADNPRVVENLAGLCQRFAEEEIFWDLWVEETLAGQVEPHAEGGVLLPIQLFCQFPAAVSARLSRALLREVRGDLRRIAACHLRMIYDLAHSDRPQGEAVLPGAWVARRYDQLWFRADEPVPLCWSPLVVESPGDYPLPDGRSLRVEFSDDFSGETPSRVEFDIDQISFPLRIELFSPGTSFQPDGMSGHCKLQDLFTDLKLTREQRQRQPLVFAGESLLWVVGLRRCAGRRGNDANNRVLRMTVLSCFSASVK